MREADFVAVSMVQQLERELTFARERSAELNQRLLELEDRYGLLWSRNALAAIALDKALHEPNLTHAKNLATLALNTLLAGTVCSEPAGELDSHE